MTVCEYLEDKGGRLSELFYAVFCVRVVHDDMQTHELCLHLGLYPIRVSHSGCGRCVQVYVTDLFKFY